ncbi:MAG: hypothetical protein ABEH43_11040, partial [Flavobacteriales bacterium]
PEGWISENAEQNTTDPIEGNTALKINIDSASFGPAPIAGAAIIGDQTTFETGEPYDKRPEKLEGYVRYNTLDTVFVNITLTYWDNTNDSAITVGSGGMVFNGKEDSWHKVSMQVNYFCDTTTPDSIQIVMAGTADKEGGVFEADGFNIFGDNLCKQTPGESDSASVCKTSTELDLFNVLNGDPTLGGTWSDLDNSGILSPDGTIDPSQVGSLGTYRYRYTVEGGSNCSSCSATATVTIGDKSPTAKITPQLDTITCSDTLITLDGKNSTPSNLNYNWSTDTGNITTSASADSIVVDADGKYILKVTEDTSACPDKDTATVIKGVNVPSTTINNLGEDTLTCNTTTTSLKGSSSSADVIYQWNTDMGNITSSSSNDTITVNDSGRYALKVTDTTNDCSNSSSYLVDIDTTLSAEIISNINELTCDIDSALFDGTRSTDNVTYKWSTNNGNIIGSNSNDSVIVDKSAKYELKVMKNGCTDSTTFTLGIDTTSPSAKINSPVNTLDCDNNSTTLDGSNSTPLFIQYQWVTNNGNITSNPSNETIDIDTAGTYTLTVTDLNNGCTDSKDHVINWDAVDA